MADCPHIDNNLGILRLCFKGAARGWARLLFGRQGARARLTEQYSTGRPWNRAPATYLVIASHFIFAQSEIVGLPYYHYCSESGDKIQLGLQLTTFYLDNVGVQPSQKEPADKDKDPIPEPESEEGEVKGNDFISPIKPVSVDQTWPESQNLLL